MALASLTIDINARMASIEKDMGRVSHIAEQQAARMEAAFAKVGPAVAGIFAGLSVGAVATAFRGIVDQLDALNDAADATGSSIENISGLEDVAKRTGGSLEDVTSILVKFNSVLKEADGKNGVSQALKAIGLDANELRKIDPAEALQKTAEALAGYADDGNKARLVQVLFGKSVKEAAPFLKDLAEQGRLNVKVTAEQAAEAEKFNKQLATLQTNINGTARAIVSDMLPALNKLMERANKGGFFAALGFDDAFKDKAKLAGVASELTRLASQKESFEKDLKSEPYNVEYSRRLAEINEQLVAAKKNFKDAYASFQQQERVAIGDATMGAYVPRWSAPKPSVPDAGGGKKSESPKVDRTSEIEREIEALTRKVQTTKDLTESEKLLADIERGRYKGASVQDLGKAFDLAGQIDQVKELDDAWNQVFQTLDEQQKLASKNAEEAARYFEASLTPAEKLEQNLARINELYSAGAFGAVGSADAIEKQARAISAAKDETDQLNDSARELADIFTRAAERGDDLGKALETIIKKKLLFDPMAKSLELGFQSLLSFGGSFFSGGSGSSNPGQYALTTGSGSGMGLKLPGHKDGLAYVPRDDYVARLHKGERVLTAKENASYSAGGGITVIQNNTIGSNVSRADVVAAMEQARQSTLATIAESQRNRGAFA